MVICCFIAIARVHRQISDPTGGSFIPDHQSPLQVATPTQELSPAASPSPNTRQFLTLGIKSPPFPHPQIQQPNSIRPPTPSKSPHDFPQTPTTPDDMYAQSPATPKPGFQPRLTPVDPYAHQPGTPRPQFAPRAVQQQQQQPPPPPSPQQQPQTPQQQQQVCTS